MDVEVPTVTTVACEFSGLNLDNYIHPQVLTSNTIQVPMEGGDAPSHRSFLHGFSRRLKPDPPDGNANDGQEVTATRSLAHLPLPKHSWIRKPREWFHSKKSEHRDMRSASTDAIHNRDGDDDTDEENNAQRDTAAQSSSRTPTSVNTEPLQRSVNHPTTSVAPGAVEASIKDAEAAIAVMKPLLGPAEAAASTISQVDDPIDLMDPALSLVSALSQFNRIVDDISTVHPYVHAAWSILGAASKLIVNQVERDKSVHDLLLKMDKIYKLLNETESEKIRSPAMKSALERISQQTLECVYFIQKYAQDHKFRQRLIKHLFPNTNARIQGYQQALDELLQELLHGAELSTSLTVQRIWDEVQDIQDFAWGVDLNSMPYAGGAGLKLDKVCLDGTRKEILDEIMDWASNTDNSAPRIFWLHGTAGKGKSAIAHTIARRFRAIQRLGSCFCFDRSELAQKRHQTILTTIARDLSDHDKHMRNALASAVHEDSSLRTTTDPIQQWRELILKPAKKLSDVMSGPILIVIDALDESGERDSRDILLRILAGKLNDDESHIRDLPANVRILLTSRLLPDISKAFDQVDHIREKSMDDISASSTEDDILSYISGRLVRLTWLKSEDHLSLARASDGLFEWARLACAYIDNDDDLGGTEEERFQSIITNTEGAHLLDGMYRLSLEAIFQKALNPELALARFRSVMAQIIITREPLPLQSLTTMRGFFSDSDVRSIKIDTVIRPMGALLSGTRGSSAVRPLHTSFLDFLLNKEQSGNFFIDTSNIHHDLAFSCLGIMGGSLRFNICNLPSSYLANSEVRDLDKQIDENISPELSYACRFWTDHLHRAAFAMSLSEAVRAFFGHEQMLFWLEVLSLLKKMNTCYAALSRVIEWVTPDLKLKSDVEGRKFSYKDIADDAADAQHFVRVFGGAISFSTPHLYISALPFSPKNSRISQKFVRYFPNTLKTVQGQQKSWPVVQAVLRGHTAVVASVVFSPDGRKIASGSVDQTIRIWDAETGEAVRPPCQGHSFFVYSVAFSPDGKKIASGSGDTTVRLWDSETGEAMLPPLKGHSGGVTSVAFSSNGKQVASGSEDGTMQLWSTETGQQLGPPLEGDNSSLAFSLDGRYIVSASWDNMIRLWDVKNMQQLSPILEGHSDSVQSVTFSTDSSLIVSGSEDTTIRLWDVQTRKQLGGPLTGHTGTVNSVKFSPDGTRIISGSADATVRLWSVKTRQQLGSPLRHEGRVTSVAFSPDGRRIVSGSWDKTLRIWDAESTEEELRAPSTGHKELISSIAFSPDGRQIASGSYDKTIRLWNAEMREQLRPPLEGHERNINSVAFSPDGKRLISGSDDKTVRVWDVEKGEQLVLPLQGHTNFVLSVAFSPDGKLIASGSADKTVRLWETDTWEQLQPPLEGHDEWIQSIAFSFDGGAMVSGSHDNTLRVWDVKERKALGQPFRGHEAWVRSVVFSPDSASGRLIASGSDDKTIRLWSAEEGSQFGSQLQILAGHDGIVFSVVFSFDGLQIFSGSRDKTVRIWNAQSGEQLCVLHGHQDIIRTIAYSPISRHIASGSDDKTIRICEAETGWELRQGLDSEVFSRTDQHLICFSTSWDRALRDNRASSSSTYMTAEAVEVDDQGWTRFKQDKSLLLFWAPQPYKPQWLHPQVRMIPAPEVQLDLSRMAHGSEWHLCYDSNTGQQM
ncbi:hypothetical protein CVT26_003476 [Gymnopilus dilepis]|uniref:NACHT domain-containing protein n=1 Tax=Gymnopilus dilepis TaxID=231916 RepID=A0A409W2W7_9AGAR|nr:hypothetical protein CVT26_003476 [Gymnopilus dilepis]